MPKIDKTGQIISLNLKRKQKHATMKKSAPGRSPARVIAITSGKGGVGKTNIVANLGYALCKAGNRVLIFDADLGLGNLDVLLGLTPRYNLSHVIEGKKELSEIIVSGPGNLKILPASSGIQELTKLTAVQKLEIYNKLNALLMNYDIVLIDTAAGISSNVLYFNVSANEIMVVVTPEPTSITDAYALMKILSVRYQEKRFRLLVNLAKNEKEADEVSRQLCLVADRFLDVSIDYFGHVPVDDNVKAGVRKQKVVCEMAPMTRASRNFAELAHRLARSEPMISRSENRPLIWQDII
ncbi:site-determining protein [Desulfosarcina alkanivorans]|uniref:Site-determining protein n=1 Tax=Desulfosarcina alkanivorans TaxID=571177 RepID=A0A5K7YCV7_9BACT|nr:MinD/ParA family protein [Desulfosarcina alkanivorans]BBO66776.1 site-determining protein [Desulfosarcina alkanivorans]